MSTITLANSFAAGAAVSYPRIANVIEASILSQDIAGTIMLLGGDNGFVDFLSQDTDPATIDLLSTSDPTEGGADEIYGDGGFDIVMGGTDADQIWGGGGHDVLLGDHGRDTIFADDGLIVSPSSVGWLSVLFGDVNGDDADDLVARTSSGQWLVGVSDGTQFNLETWALWSTAVTWEDLKLGDLG